MKITKFYLQNNLISKNHLNFSKDNVLIYSKNNATGKTTFLRALLYAMGYQIPSTKEVDFSKWILCLEIQEKGVIYTIERAATKLTVKSKDSVKEYSLPSEHNYFLKDITGISNHEILNSLLGIHYLDQEKGWTLLNRGTVIGKIHFKIEDFVAGVSNYRLDDIQKEKKHIENIINYYETVVKLKKLQFAFTDNQKTETYEEKIINDSELSTLILKKTTLKNQISEIKEVLVRNKKFSDLILKLKLVVNINNKQYRITKDELASFNQNNSFLIAKKEDLEISLKIIEEKIQNAIKYNSSKNTKHSNNSNEFSLYTNKYGENLNFVSKNLSLNISINFLTESILAYKKEIKFLNNKLKNDLYSSECSKFMEKEIRRYLQYFNVPEPIYSNSSNILYTSDLKSLSGSILYFFIVSFRLAYIKCLTKYTGLIFPIILDSPSAKELKLEAVQAVIDLISKEFSDHQLIIASIYDYSLSNFSKYVFDNWKISGEICPSSN